MTLGSASRTAAAPAGAPPWTPEHPVREVLRARRESGSKPGERTDGFKVGLAVEGGGLRGVVSASMLTALEDLGYADTVDDVYATSSGAMNAAYFITRDTWFPLSIYFDDLTTGEFLDFRRVLRGRPPMRLDYVFDEVAAHRKPLDYPGIIAAAQRLHVAVTDVDELRPLDVADFTSPEDLRSALLAGAWLPLALRGTARFRGHRAMDGGLLRAHPFRAAVLDGCTHVLSLSTVPIGPLPTRVPVLERVVGRHLDRVRPGLGSGFLADLRHYLHHDLPLLRRTRRHPEPGPYLLDLAPLPGTPEVKRHELDRGRLLDGARSAYRAAHLALEATDTQVIPRLTPRPL
jgi:predicted patatin/cPLA2 family phospholipase